MIIVLVPLLIIISGIAFSTFMARRQALTWIYPVRNLPDLLPEDRGMNIWQEVQFTTSDGINIVGWFIKPEADSEPRETVILLHGLAGNRRAGLTEAALLNHHGYNTLLIDLRNHGESGGTVTTLGYSEIEDVRAAVDYLLTRDDVNPDGIGLMGSSLGGVVALRAAARIPEIKAVIASSTFKTVEDNVTPIVKALTGRPPIPFPSAVLWLVNLETGVNVHEVRPIDDLKQITPRPVLFIHGESDPVIHVSNSQDMFEAAGEPKELFIIPGGEHSNLYGAAPEEFEQRVIGFFDRYLRDEGIDETPQG